MQQYRLSKAGLPPLFWYECAVLATVTVCTYFLAQAGVAFGHTRWIPLWPIAFANFGLTEELGCSWDNMLGVGFALLFVGALTREFPHRKTILKQFIDFAPTPYPKIKNKFVRPLFIAGIVVTVLTMFAFGESAVPTPTKGDILSLIVEGIGFRAFMLCNLYLFARLLPYVLAREYLVSKEVIEFPKLPQ